MNLFDAGSEGSDGRGGAGPTALTVSAVAHVLGSAVDGSLGQVWVKGEVRDLKVVRNGHWYFTLRDPEAQIRCIIWQSNAARIKVRPEEGAEVFIRARPSYWRERGEVRLTAVTLLPSSGLGPRQQEFLRVRQALAADGLLDPAAKRALPAYPRKVAMVTSADGAALHDLVTVARRRWPSVRLYLVAASVQGERAVEELGQALALVKRLTVDACVVARGGGSKEDLDAFNAESVCRAVAALAIPVVSAVGHETDVTLTDLVADVRAATPSHAMELLLPDRVEAAEQVAHLATRLSSGLRRRTTLVRERLFRSQDRMQSAVSRRVTALGERVARHGAALDVLSPLKTLERGYAVARSADDGRVLSRVADLPAGTGFRLGVRDGEVPARVEAS